MICLYLFKNCRARWKHVIVVICCVSWRKYFHWRGSIFRCLIIKARWDLANISCTCGLSRTKLSSLRSNWILSVSLMNIYLFTILVSISHIASRFTNDFRIFLHFLFLLLKMIGKGFVLFKINSSPSAFYIIKPTCISWLVFKVSNYFKKLSESSNPKLCLHCRVMTSAQGGIKTCSLFLLENGVRFNIWDVVSGV